MNQSSQKTGIFNASDFSHLRLMSWNLWFDDYYLVERMMMVLSYIEPLQPHIIAFQELTTVSELLLEDSESPLYGNFFKVKSKLPDWQWYWEGIYSRLPIGQKSIRYPYSISEMGRGITILHVPKFSLTVGCTHLESENEHETRRRQIMEAIEWINSFNSRNKIILGDTNIRDHQPIDDLLPSDWCDVWLKLNPYQTGYTVDSIRNPMCIGNRLDRLDRIYCSCRDYHPRAIYLIGDQEIGEGETAVMPSDHFGLVLDLER